MSTSAQAQLGPPWEWRVNVIPGQVFSTQAQAEIALRSLGGKYALAEIVEDIQMTETSATYTYAARPRGPNVGPWYAYQMQQALTNPHPTEESAISSVVAWGNQNRQSCTGPTVVTPINDWRAWRNWYSGHAYEETRNYTVAYDIPPACDRGNMPAQAWRYRVVECPTHMSWNSAIQACELRNIATISVAVSLCCQDKVGDSVSTGTGATSYSSTDVDLPWISFQRNYLSSASPPYGGFGPHWTNSFNVRLSRSGTTAKGILGESAHQLPIRSNEVVDGSGERVQAESGLDKWKRSDGSIRSFNTSGRLVRDDFVDGRWYTYIYDTYGRLSTISHSSGRTLTVIYEAGYPSADSRIDEIRFGTSTLVSYDYDAAGNLSVVHRADGRSTQYHYEDPAFPNHLTGVSDENGSRLVTYAYDAYGRAILNERAGGHRRVELAYNTDGSTSVTDALGRLSIYRFTDDGYSRKPISIESEGATQSWTIPTPNVDFRRRPTQVVDRNGLITKFEYSQYYDYSINNTVLRTRRTEAFGTPRARVGDEIRHYGTGRLWKEIRGIEEQIYTYNARGQVLTQTRRDAATGAQRIVTNAYCEAVNLAQGCPWIGLLKSIDGPRTDVTDLTTFTYDAQGNLATVTNALGHVTTYNSYDAHGLATQITDANGLVTSMAYDLRHRLTDRCVGGTLPGCVGGELTHLDYWPTGLMKKATNPDGSFIEYFYDAAHRLTEIRDGALNRVVYTLDDAGNRTAEDTYDTSNALRRTHTRVYNTLNQLWKDVNAAGTAAVTTTFGYDHNGNQTSVNAPLGRNSTSLYDELNRLKQITDPASGVTQYGYDANDNLTSVTDPRGLVTSYTYSGFKDLKTQTSPDTGLTTKTYDSGGNLDTSTDSRGAVSDYSYDVANRVTSVSFTLNGTTDQTIHYGYDAGTNQKGRLTSAWDAEHSLAWTYDAQGRVTGKGQTIGATTLAIGYGYNSTGQLGNVTLPSGNVITFGYDTNGRVSGLTLNGSTTLLNNLTYDAFGPITGWTWGNGTSASRDFDTDGKITQVDNANGASLKTYSYDDAFRITGITDALDPALSWAYGYDALDRLNWATSASTVQGWTYDANGNRLTETGTTPSTYSNSATSNRVASISGSLPRTYAYDNAGNTLSYGTATFTYNNRGRMATASNAGTTATYTYNALGQRIRRATSGVTTLYVYDEAGHLVGEYAASGALVQETVWLGDMPVATLRPNGSGGVDVFYVHADHLNTPRLVTDTSNNIRWRWDSDAFGTTVPNQNPASLGLFDYNLRFPGQQYDPVVGLNYNYFRDYDPATGRYTQSDPIGLEGGLNTYGYVNANPVALSDPTGLVPGPWHPPGGVKFACRWSDTCPQLKAKMWVIMRMINSHQGWDRHMPRPRGGNRHHIEIAALWQAYGKCQAIYNDKRCEECGPDKESPPENCRSMPVAETVVVGGVAYVIWKIVKTCGCGLAAGPPGAVVCAITP